MRAYACIYTGSSSLNLLIYICVNTHTYIYTQYYIIYTYTYIIHTWSKFRRSPVPNLDLSLGGGRGAVCDIANCAARGCLRGNELLYTQRGECQKLT